MSSNHGRRYRVSKIQDGSQLTGSSNIFETMKHMIKTPTATPMFLGSSFLVVVLPISWDVDCALEIQDGSQIIGSIIISPRL